MRDEPIVMLKYHSTCSYRYHEGCLCILTVGMWPWKLESSKECVTTHQPNAPAPKMDDA